MYQARANFLLVLDYTAITHGQGFNKDIKNNVIILIGGFVEGKLVFILKVPFNFKELSSFFKEKLKKVLPNGDEPSRYIRSLKFSYMKYKNCKEVKLIYFDKKFKGNLTIPFFRFLEKLDCN